MIPPTLDDFRKLMQRVANVRVRGMAPIHPLQMASLSSLDQNALMAQQLAGPHCVTTLSRDDRRALEALATATPAQLLAIVGAVQEETVERPDYYGKTGRLIVTPREDA